MRKTPVAAALLLTTMTPACAGHPVRVTTSSSVRVAPVPKPTPATTQTPTPTPRPTAAKPSPHRTGVAVPGCLGPEYKPDWWTPTCGDAGYQLEPVWDTWTATSATAHGRVGITHGPLAGQDWAVHVTFDRPRRVAGYGGRPLFSRLVVHYDNGHGPDGTATETWPLESIWETAIEAAAEPVTPCTTDPAGVSNCAPGDLLEQTDPAGNH